jgi:hypothetical protein
LQPQILGIEARHDIADSDRIADIDDAGDDLASDTEAEIGFVAGPHHAHEFPRAIRVLEAHALDLNWAFGLWRWRRIGSAAGDNKERSESGKRMNGAREPATRPHGSVLQSPNCDD